MGIRCGGVDIETTTKTLYGRKANPFLNSIVAIGFIKKGITYTKYKEDDWNKVLEEFLEDLDVIFAHNAKFECLYFWNFPAFQIWLQKGGRVFCTQLCQYYLSGQQHKYPALRDVAVNKYGCKEREKVMEKYWEQGVCTSEIPKDFVLEDVTNDALDTEAVYIQQIKKAEETGMLKYIELMMDSLLATTEAEYNGIKVNHEKLLENKAILEKDLESRIDSFIKLVVDLGWPQHIEPFSVTNPGHLSLLLFGGELKTKVRIPIVDTDNNYSYYKTGQNIGQIKTKLGEKLIPIQGLGIKPLPDTETARKGIYKTNEEVLEKLVVNVRGDKKRFDVVKQILKIRGIGKQISTYYTSTENHIYEDGLVHPCFDHSNTITGRLASSHINAQNQPTKEKGSVVTQHFISRFPNGKLVSSDYSQIEIVVQAELSKDEKYQQDVLSGIDFHCMRLALKEHLEYSDVIDRVKIQKDPVWINKRKTVKEFSFQRSYGAGKVSIAASTGLGLDEVGELIKLEDLNYEGLKRFNDKLAKTIEFTAVQVPGQRYKVGWCQTFLGKKYYFREYIAPQFLQDKGVYWSFKPQQIKNYPIQGTAFDIAAMMLGKFWREKLLYKRDKYLFINMVHDSFMFDCREEFLQEAVEDCQYLTNLKPVLKAEFGYDWKLPVKIEVKTGESWYDC